MKKIVYTRLLFILCMFFCSSASIVAQDKDEGDNPCKVNNRKAEKIFNEGVAEMKSRKYPEAIKLFKQAIDEESDYPDAYFSLGKIYLIKQKQAEGNTTVSNVNYLSSVKRYFKKVVELCPTYNIYCYYTLGDIYLGEEKLDSAYYYMNKFIADPDKIKNTADLDHADSVVKYTKTLKTLTSKKVPFNPVFVKNISTPMDEYMPLISPDNEMAFFVRKVKQVKSRDQTANPDNLFKEKFMYSMRTTDGEFDSGQEMPYPFNTTENQGAATITIDNKTLYFTFCEWLKDHSYYNCDICMSEYKNDKWSEIKNLGPKVNGQKTWESQPSISSDGNTLYFISDRPGGYGGYDIYRTTKDSTGQWTLAENLGPNINSSANEKSPYIHTDNMTLYFSSQGWPGLGGYDIFYSKKDKNGKFGKPVNIGYPINTEADDVGFTVSTDGHYGYYASDKYNGPGGMDIYSFDLYPEARPAKVLMVKGNVKDEINNEATNAKIELKNIATNQIREIPVDSASGKYIFAALYKDDYILSVKKDDYAYTSKYISKEDSVIAEAPTNVKIDFAVKPIEVGESYRINDIHFEYGKYDLSDESKRIIDEFFEFLSDHPHMKVSINGHTDNVSGAEFNQTLSENRAKAVYDYLVSKGVDSSRLTYKGYGLTKPLASNDTEEGRAKNRRTEFVIIEK